MTNNGGRIFIPGVWQLAIAAGAIATEATIQNTSAGLAPKFDPNGINNGPAILVWPYPTDPNNLGAAGSGVIAGRNDGALVCVKQGDAIKFTSTQTGAVYVFCEEPGGSFAAPTS